MTDRPLAPRLAAALLALVFAATLAIGVQLARWTWLGRQPSGPRTPSA